MLDGIDGKKNLKELYEIGDNASARKILKFINKKPRWNKQKKCFQMDFHGKMKIPSVKNMILVDAESQKEEVLLLGKIEDHAFNMDVNYPLSPRIALAIANSSFDFKWVSQ